MADHPLARPCCLCDFSKVPGVVWWGTREQMPLAQLAAYLGLRLRIKSRGFFDVNHISYVIEFGAGSF